MGCYQSQVTYPNVSFGQPNSICCYDDLSPWFYSKSLFLPCLPPIGLCGSVRSSEESGDRRRKMHLSFLVSGPTLWAPRRGPPSRLSLYDPPSTSCTVYLDTKPSSLSHGARVIVKVSGGKPSGIFSVIGNIGYSSPANSFCVEPFVFV